MVKINILKSLFFGTLICFISSCDRASYAVIINESGHNVDVEIKFSKERLQEGAKGYGGFEKYLSRNIDFFKSQGSIIKTDALNYTAILNLKHRDTFLVDGGLKPNPDFARIREINIISKKINLTNDKIQTAFKKVDATLYELKIK